ncbi:MAG: ribosomal RNA small subunit methyltransferase A [Deltaproteobacteria bacterium]|nr:ribosomal RNA small subunit methyltransferase A [Deltaproteobacteria bacterium]
MTFPKFFRPDKRLGQHFLRDSNLVNKIIRVSKFQESDQVLEIGAGMGDLTIPLARRVRQVVAVEKDHRLIPILDQRLSSAGIRNVELVNADILRIDFLELPLPWDKGVSVIGNLPFNISSPMLEKLIQYRKWVNRAILMFQFELAKRLTASPGTREYGAITVLLRYYAGVTPLLVVPREAFYPRPKVGALVLEIDFAKPYPKRARDDAGFDRIVHAAFSHRRKTLINSLKAGLRDLGPDVLLRVLEESGIDPRSRAESLDMEEFLCLGNAFVSLSLTKNDSGAIG